MRIAQVNDVAFVASTLAAALRDLGADADFIQPWRPGAGLPYPWKAGTWPFRLGGVARTAVQVRRGGYDVAHVHWARLAILGRLAGRPYVVHCHGSDVRDSGPGSPWGRVMLPSLRRAGHVYYTTPDLRPAVIALRPDATFLPNPVVMHPSPDGSGPTPDRDLLVGVRLDPIKGADEIVEIVGSVIALRPATTVTVIRQGSEVERLAAAVPGARVIDPVAHRDLPLLFARHRVAIGQFRVGAIGNLELEAMASSVPVAAAFRYPEAYDEPPPLIDGPDPQAIASRVAHLLDREVDRIALAVRARAWVAAHHAAPVVAARLLADYARIGLAVP